EDRARLPFTARDGVEAPVHAINEIDVGNARSTVERIRPSGTASSGVARQIVLAEVRLRFDDAAAGDTITRPTLEYRTEQVTRDGRRRLRAPALPSGARLFVGHARGFHFAHGRHKLACWRGRLRLERGGRRGFGRRRGLVDDTNGEQLGGWTLGTTAAATSATWTHTKPGCLNA